MASASTPSAVNLAKPNFSICSNIKTNKKSTLLRRNALYWYKLCCDRFNMLGENSSEEMMCASPRVLPHSLIM